MSHFAQLDENNVVLQVLVGDNNDPAGDEGYQWFVDNLGGTWVKTSYNGNIRKNYAGINYTYDPIRDAFIAPKPYESWLLEEETCQWKAPVAYPTDGVVYEWDETITDWKAIIND
jgi:hypothetical protein